MSVLFAAFLGLVQGLTEFLPVSSSGHLSIFQNFFGMEDYESSHMMFDVMLHLGTLAAVIFFYRKDIAEIIKELIEMIRGLFTGREKKKEAGADGAPRPTRRLILMVIVATLPLIVVLPLNKYIERLYYSTLFVGLALILTGCILFLSDKVVNGRKSEKDAAMADALLVGVMQAVATIPGVSRSGSTITAGLLRGFERSFAVKFSFLLSIPAVLGANLLTFVDALKSGFDKADIPACIVGVIVSAVVGYLALGLVRLLTNKGKFGKFSYYCWAVGALTVLATIIL
ncbi:MAG: undecaprenyl-diphosphate phosphatase [Oscillospiraceae bacterium]|nr:undecaprenyl-diphosphate phosphatase [Oscillospiraceae bacterium]